MTNPKDPQAELREAIQQIFEKRVDEAVKFVNPKYAYHGSYQAAIDEILALFQAREQQLLTGAKLPERAWAYKNMRDHGTDPQWVEIAKLRMERLQNKTNDGGST